MQIGLIGKLPGVHFSMRLFGIRRTQDSQCCSREALSLSVVRKQSLEVPQGLLSTVNAEVAKRNPIQLLTKASSDYSTALEGPVEAVL